MAEPNNDKSEFILASGEYGYYLDRSKGNVLVMVGPYQKSLTTNTESPMQYDPKSDRLIPCSVQQAQLRFPSARQGQYIVLENPSHDAKNPSKGGASPAAELQMGRKINIPGPVEFPLWPMQKAIVIDGHQLRTDQYLIVQVYDEEEAKKNNGSGFTLRDQRQVSRQDPENTQKTLASFPTTLGHRFLVKGTDIAFYIPPTGYEVVPQIISGHNGYIRTAVSLESLEYCILLDEDGNRRIEKGPQVVFPEPTETFVTDGSGNTKFRALELDEIKGIYIKVTEDYTEGETTFKHGDEIFITGKDQKIYFPRKEHALVSYEGKVIHHGIAIPNGEGRYVLQRKTGQVKLVEGPTTYLPNPIEEVVIRRILTEKESALIYPGNKVVADTNESLRAANTTNEPLRASISFMAQDDQRSRSLSATTAGGVSTFERGSSYTPPRTITLDSKFEGAVRIDVWPGFAVLVVNGKGQRRVVQGPSTTLLRYDETLHRFTLSTGTPKSNDKLIEGVYLQTTANSVTDRVTVETKDLCELEITLSYKVNFEGQDPEKWFSVADYIGLLTSSLRSILRKAAKQHGVMEFLQSAPDIVRDIILGKAETGQERRGKVFTENAMRVYDVDLLDVTVEDQDVGKLIEGEQMIVFRHNLKLAEFNRQIEIEKAHQELNGLKIALDLELATQSTNSEQQKAKAKGDLEKLHLEMRAAIEQAQATSHKELEEIKLQVEKARAEQDDSLALADIEAERKRKNIEVEAQAALLKALGECKLPEALISIGDGSLLESMSENLSVLSMLGGKSLVDVLNGVLQGTPLADRLKSLTDKSKLTE